MRQTCSLADFSGQREATGCFSGRDKICIQTGLTLAGDEINHAFTGFIIEIGNYIGNYEIAL